MTASLHAGKAPVRGVRVDLFRIVPSGRQKVTTLTTDAAGSVSAVVRPTATGRWYWRFAGTASYGASGTRVTVRVTAPAKPVEKPLGERAVLEAARHLGAPYVYGATGPRTFDCSGFTRFVYAKLGVSLPRTAAQQYGAVRHVANADRQPGDLIFFRLGGGGIDHVGIYAGNGVIIVAPKTGDHVKYEAIWTSYQVGRIS
jgi:cell wall-associated NlpC family hydrolase